MSKVDEYLKSQGVLDEGKMTNNIFNMKRKETIRAIDYLKTFGYSANKAKKMIANGGLICNSKVVKSVDEEVVVRKTSFKLGYGK